MSEATIQARVQTLIQAIAAFDDEDVTLGDYLVLDRGSPPYAIIVPGPLEQARDMPGIGVSVDWTIYIDVVERFIDDSYAPLVTARQAVLDQLNAYPDLNGLTNIIHALVLSGEPLQYLYPEGGGDVPQFVLARLVLSVTEAC